MDGEFRRKVVYLRTESGYEYDAQGLAVDTETNRNIFCHLLVISFDVC